MPVSIPSSVKGSTELDRDQFTQTLQVPFIIIPVEKIQSSKWKEFLLIAPSLKNVRDLEPPVKTQKQILFDPEKIQNKNDLIERLPALKEYIDKTFDLTSITINYTNYTIEQVIKAILPDDLMLDKRVNNGSGYSLIGHIAHFNLRDEVLPFKRIIAQVILDKLPNVKTVVNKLHEIDSVYRNFELEIIAGDSNTVVQCRESGAMFEFDFAKVYWNPRLSTEHERIVKLLRSGDFVFDVCAGIGPFVVPASMLGCKIFANDINPECFKWLHVNLKRNQPKKLAREYQIWNLDGREFLKTVVFPGVEQIQRERTTELGGNSPKIVVLMNLPALALTFFDVISSWLSTDVDEKAKWTIPMEIFCYTFSREENREIDIRSRLNEVAKNILPDEISCRFVRQVAPNKDMMCVLVELFKRNSSTLSPSNVKRFKSDINE